MNKLKGIVKILFVVFVLVLMVALGSASAVYYENWEKNLKENDSQFAQFITGNRVSSKSGDEEKKLEPNLTCLFMGRNAHLTDFIMLGQYNPNTREVSLLSIPRDTYVDKASVDGKINSIYMYKYPEKVVAKVQEITGVEIQHYVVFNAKILQQIVNTIGGVTVEVPFNMNYDDPYQNLYIHLNKGTQRLTGAQAEQFVRFRKNNDGTGFADGDVGRIRNQQKFIKAAISELLKPANIAKIPDLIKIVIDGTDTDVTADIIEQYVDDVVTFKTDRIRIETLPGVGQYGKGPDGQTRSFFYYNAEETKTLVNDLFFKSIDEVSGDTTSGDVENVDNENKDSNNSNNNSSNNNKTSNENTQSVNSSSLETDVNTTNEKTRVEVLNAKAQTSKLNNLVEKLNSDENNFNVVKIGNYSSTKVESSRIITYGEYNEDELAKLKELTGISKVEESSEDSTVVFSVLIGPNY